MKRFMTTLVSTALLVGVLGASSAPPAQAGLWDWFRCLQLTAIKAEQNMPEWWGTAHPWNKKTYLKEKCAGKDLT